ncbi:LytTR family transcriptional regulator DNA-binding domain-containing protein [Companilactobacillus alimentarius]|uniref:LytR/AlgR family response regulator transcription factor n=1 Tax=Companilactobacillus alimentarius TaxID=1602 RepID=UPI0028BB70FC|nr:LytTR family DNA-binding domain-containing protein [Companilactobacillus alimentarius]MDT6952010.1 LytTR family DNA-binding domain-containing protein [Companilactobacillus alimentarius]
MLKILILEDDIEQRKAIVDFMKRYIEFENIDACIDMQTDDVKRILDSVNSKDDILVFLDIEIGNDETSGIRLAENIRGVSSSINIVFITSHEEMSLLTLERRIAPLDYIVKSLKINDIEEDIRKDINLSLQLLESRVENNEKFFGYKLRNRFYKEPMDSVLYIESVPNHINRVILHTKESRIEIKDSLHNIENKYNNLFRVHKGFLVNPRSVVSLDTMTNTVFFDKAGLICCPLAIEKRDYSKKS